mmetsp:Transcript_19486/g.29947  ORF Transcript_19486/g.29947 Transcript_19486/m.29947 type:complete len:297 (+) Transcript_19486:1413-2303(+)
MISDAGAKNAMKHNKDNRLWNSLINFDSQFLEDTLLQSILDCLEVMSKAKVFLFLPLEQRIKLQSAVCFHVLAVSGLQHNHGLSASSSLCKLVRIAGNLVVNCNSGDGCVQSEMLGALQNFKEKAFSFEMSNYPGSQELATVLEQVLVNQLDSVMAPRKQEKYFLPQSTLTHLSLERRGLFMSESQSRIKDFILEQRAPAKQDTEMDSESQEEEKPASYFQQVPQQEEDPVEEQAEQEVESEKQALPTAVPTLGGDQSPERESGMTPFKEQEPLPTHFKSSAALLEKQEEAEKNMV